MSARDIDVTAGPDTRAPQGSAEALHRQMERGTLFTHSALGESFARLGEAQAFLHGLADVLLAKGVIADEELVAAVETARTELRERGELLGAGVMVRTENDGSAEQPPVAVDCAARMHLCKAVCCRLDFALSVPEVESGRIRWDLGRPYFIRKEAHGGCTHHDPGGGGCRIYADRPGVCRRYSCANDARIWKDFDRMELNTEWIEANLYPREEPRAMHVKLHAAVPAAPSAGDS